MDVNNHCKGVPLVQVLLFLIVSALLGVLLLNYTYIGWRTILIENYGTIAVPSSWFYEMNDGMLTLYDRNGKVMTRQIVRDDNQGYVVEVDGLSFDLEGGELQNTATYSGLSAYGERVYHLKDSSYRICFFSVGSMTYSPSLSDAIFVLEDECSRRVAKKITRSYVNGSYEIVALIEALQCHDVDKILGLFSKSVPVSSQMTMSIEQLIKMFPGEYAVEKCVTSELNCPRTSVQNPPMNYSVYMVGKRYVFILVGCPRSKVLSDDIGLRTLYVLKSSEYESFDLSEVENEIGVVIRTQGEIIA